MDSTIRTYDACQVPDDDSWAVDNPPVHYAAIDPDWQTSYAVGILLCANIVDKFENLCMDDVVKIDDMSVLVRLLHVLQPHNFYEF